MKFDFDFLLEGNIEITADDEKTAREAFLKATPEELSEHVKTIYEK